MDSALVRHEKLSGILNYDNKEGRLDDRPSFGTVRGRGSCEPATCRLSVLATGWLEALPLLLFELFCLFFLRRKFGLVGLRLGFLVFAFRHASRVHRMSP